MFFSIIIPVYNRPDEIKELLESLLLSTYTKPYEIVIIEDGSTITSKEIVESYSQKLRISYYFKENSGPGDSRNFGMQNAKGNYFIILDSDCIIPKNYLENVNKQLNSQFVDCFGGPDKALKSFSNVQKAINFAMTSFLTTGGIRGGSEKINKFQPRSFNMGISKKAFIISNGFGNIHPGEDPDLSIRLWKLGFETRLFSDCYVYHKRRIDWQKFSLQVSKFGKARPILNSWYPAYSKITYWFPSIFVIGFFTSILSLLLLENRLLLFYFFYFILIFILSTIQNKSIIVGYYSVIAVWKQFFGYGLAFLKSFFLISILNKEPKETFPELFFNVSKKIQATTSFAILKNVNEDPIIKTKIIGLTGGIGSGKSTIAKHIESLGIPVYIADIEAKKVMELPEIVNQIVTNFDNSIIDNGIINREKLAAIVFNDPEKLKLLNAIVHPAVKKHFSSWLNQHNNFSIIVKEAAILFESGSYKECDAIISVIAPLELRIDRVVKRDNATREKVIQRINNQLSDEERIAKSNFIINNIDLKTAQVETETVLNLLKNV